MLLSAGQLSKLCPLCSHAKHGFAASKILMLALTLFATTFLQLSMCVPSGPTPDKSSSSSRPSKGFDGLNLITSIWLASEVVCLESILGCVLCHVVEVCSQQCFDQEASKIKGLH